jgi:transcriptional regulator with XRE-family HTH domain
MTMPEDKKPDLDILLATSDIELSFAKRLKKLRLQLGKTQSEFCNDTKISNSILSQLENSDSNVNPRMETIIKIVSTYGVSADWLLGFIPHLSIGDFSKQELINSIIKMLDFLGESVKVETSDDGNFTNINIMDAEISQFFTEWRSINELYKAGTIKKEHYELILKDLLSKVV